MKHIQGKFVKAHLKGREFPNIVSGILIGTEDEHVYIQSHPGEDGLLVVPQENIRYYQASEVSFAEEEPAPVAPIKEPEVKDLSVFVDNDFIVSIPVPPTFDLNVCTDDILRVAWGNPDVKSALTGRVQKNITYFPGVIKFNTDAAIPVPPTPPISKDSNTFSMSGAGSPATSFLSPSDMVARLSNLKNRGNNNEQQ
jgi:hypothetical protein